MRYVVYGAGAIGRTIAAALHSAGLDVVAIGRGPHLEAIRRDGLRVVGPDGEMVTRIATATSPAELDIGPEDVVILAVKSQDTQAALTALAGADPKTTVVCAQNGVANEREALRHFRNVVGMHVWMAATHLEPGVTQVYAKPAGVLDVGRYPHGTDERVNAISADLALAGFDSRPQGEVMRWKYRKLLGNLANAITALLGPHTDRGDLAERARAEGLACYVAAGIEPVTRDEYESRVDRVRSDRSPGGRSQPGGSSWQSVVRGTGSIEADHLNGEIVLLGRLHGVPTPVNQVLQRAANDLARRRGSPGDVSRDELERLIAAEPIAVS